MMNTFLQEPTKELFGSFGKPAHVMTVGLAATVDHTKTSDRDATNMLAESVKSVGHIAVVLSR